MSNTQIIWDYLASKGFSPAQIAGIMGNFQVESGFDPGSTNSNEGAHGIANWEGGRWPALQSFAASEGKSPSDLTAQLDFMWHELNTSYSGVLGQIKASNDPGQVAAIWDSQYEVSSGEARQTRIANAQAIFQAGAAGIGTYSGGGNTSVGTDSAQALQVPANLTEQQYAAALGFTAQMLLAIPDLNSLVQQAENGKWSSQKFTDAVENSNWWKQNNASARQLVALKFADPSTYATNLNNAQSQITNIAHQLGIGLSAQQLSSITQQYMIGGWDTATLQHHLAGFYNTGATPGGQAANYYQQLSQLYSDYGLPFNNATLQYRTQQMLAGNTTLDTYKQGAIEAAQGLYPSIAGQLKAGRTVRDIADPYIQTMGNLLEINPNNIGLNDPTIKRALQGSVTTTNGTTAATSTTLYDFEKQLRQDPRWATTQNAKDTMSTALTTIGKNFGFLGQ